MILCVMRIPPSLSGHGGSQRAWFLVKALCRLMPVHFVLVSRKQDEDAASVSLEPLAPLVQSVTSIDIPEWQQTSRKNVGLLDPQWINVLTMRSVEAPKISMAGLDRIAKQLPTRSPNMIFAGRLPSAVIVQALIDRKLLAADFRFVDFDDVMSKFRERQLQVEGPLLGRQGRMRLRFDVAYIRRAERRIATTWDGVGVCTDEDVRELKTDYPAARIIKIPNVVKRERLPPRSEDGKIRLLFVGNLSSLPNVQGLQAFAQDSWPAVSEALPNASLTVVGLNPDMKVLRLAEEKHFELYQNVPDMLPYYQNSDIAIVPILFGSGTRIKILEAMAHGRPIVTTRIAAEGLHLEHGRHAMVVDDMASFAAAVIALARDAKLRQRIAAEAWAFQQQEYGVQAMNGAVADAMARLR